MTRRRALIGLKQSSGRLPAEYQEVEYIESALGQWIDTGYVIQNEKIQINAIFNTTSTWDERDFIGNQDLTSNRFVFGIYAWYFFAYARGASTETNAASKTYPETPQMYNATVLYDLENRTKSLTINGESWSAQHTVNIVSATDTTVKIFSDGRNLGSFVCNLYSVNLVDGDNLAFDLVPCYRKIDSKPGMYDLVSNTFFTNAGTGEFVVGADVN